jgi:DNA-binding PadR family transcriptional regulator
MFREHRMFHGRRHESPFQKGDLKYVILDLLKDEPRHGYEIIRTLEEHSHGLYTPSPGAIYPTLQLLEEMGYIEGTQEEGRKVYSITADGLKFLSEREGFAEDIKKQMRDRWGFKGSGEVRETMAEIGRLGRLIGRRLRSVDADKMRRIREVISRAYTDIEKILDEQRAED